MRPHALTTLVAGRLLALLCVGAGATAGLGDRDGRTSRCVRDRHRCRSGPSGENPTGTASRLSCPGAFVVRSGPVTCLGGQREYRDVDLSETTAAVFVH